MFDWLLEPRTLILLGAVATGTLAVGKLRHESSRKIAANTAGIVATWAGMFWAAALGPPAFAAAILIGAGMYLMTITYERGRSEKIARNTAHADQV